MRKKNLHRIIVVVGPTASGKSALALSLARKFGGEIVSADSRQLYRGMEIAAAIEPGTWRGKGASRTYFVGGIPHHLTAILAPDEAITLAEYQRLAFAAIDGVIGRGTLPILVGGTGLYVRSVVENYRIPGVPPDKKLRMRLERLPTGRLFSMLRRRDPDYASRIPPNNRRFAIRALEVIAATGEPFLAQQLKGAPRYRSLLIGMRRGRDELDARIDSRTDEMAKAGIMAEARRLVRRYGWRHASMSALGYPQLRPALEGKEALDVALARLKSDTRRYAKRQMTWFRRDRNIRWVHRAEDGETLVKKFLSQ